MLSKPFPKKQLAMPVEQLSSKSLCAETGKHNFKDANLAEGGRLSQNVTDPHSRRRTDNTYSYRSDILTN